MSARSVLIIHRRGDVDLEPQIDEILCEETDRGDQADIDLDGQGEDARWFAEFDTKYTVDGLENAAQRLSKELDCRVDVVEEWDNRDADDPGREAYSYEHGVRVVEERTLEVPAGVEVVAVPIEALRQWRGWLEQQPFPQVGRVATGIDTYLS